MNQIPTTLIWFDVRNEAGTGVGYSEILIVGRSPGIADRPAMVYARLEVSDRQGFVEFYLPYGVYDVLALNPREGQFGRINNLQVTPQNQSRASHDIVIRGESSEREREKMYDRMLDRADFFKYNWGVF